MRSVFKDKKGAAGELVELDVQHEDAAMVVFQRDGSARQMLERAKFDELYEKLEGAEPIPAGSDAPPPVASKAPRTTYREKASGNLVKLEIREMDMNNAIFVRHGRAPERVTRKQFDELFELVLPTANPTAIAKVAVEPSGAKPDPLGPAIPSSVAPEVDPSIKLLRAHGEHLREIDDRLSEIGAKVDAIFKVVAAAPVETPTKPGA